MTRAYRRNKDLVLKTRDKKMKGGVMIFVFSCFFFMTEKKYQNVLCFSAGDVSVDQKVGEG